MATELKSSADLLSEAKGDQIQNERLPTTNRGWTFYLFFCNFSIIIGSSFMLGYNVSAVNAPFLVISQWMNETIYETGTELSEDQLNTQWSVSVTLYLIGGTVGSTWFPGFLANHIGK